MLDKDHRGNFIAYKHGMIITDESYIHLLAKGYVKKHFAHQFGKDINHNRLLVIKPTR